MGEYLVDNQGVFDTGARRTYLAAGLGLFFAMTAVYWSSQFIPSGWMSVLFGLAPIVTGLMATFLLSERALDAAQLAGMLLGLAGPAIMLLGSQHRGPQAGRTHLNPHENMTLAR
ncbi:MAG: hypothetical protein GY807_22045 [Gammaproteobacteria bacterium]|nr:hypothetical protein [Gammaproteobacteria bacterium]